MQAHQAIRAHRSLAETPAENPATAKYPPESTGEEPVMIGGIAQQLARTKSIVLAGRALQEEGENPSTGRFPPDSSGEEMILAGGVVQAMGRARAVPFGDLAPREQGENPATGRFPPDTPGEELVMAGGVAQAMGQVRAVPLRRATPFDAPQENPATGRFPPDNDGEVTVMEGGVAISAARPATKSAGRQLAAENAPQQTRALDEKRTYEDPGNFPVNLPEAGSDDDEFSFDVPDGLMLSHVDLEVLDASPLAKAEIVKMPARGSTGRQRVHVGWSHPPYGKIAYRVCAYASANGSSAPVTVAEGSPQAAERARLLMDQAVDVAIRVRGERAKRLYEAIRDKQRQAESAGSKSLAITLFEPITIMAGIAIAVILAAVVMLGFMVLYAVITNAMNKGYDVKDTKYKAGVGSGESRQDHELIFNLVKPPSV